MILIAPSILSANFSKLGEEIKAIDKAGADWIHIDIMDGQFVPALTFGPAIVKSIRSYTSIPFDIHMMVYRPERYISELADAGADMLSIHVESTVHLHRTINQIKAAGMKAGVAINPSTPISTIEEVLKDVNLVLIMTVNPGYGGQSFITNMVSKIQRIRTLLDTIGSDSELEVDGGINTTTAKEVVKAGADVLVAGSAIYNNTNSVKEAISSIRRTYNR